MIISGFPKKFEKFLSKQQAFAYKKGEIIIRASEDPLNVYFIENGYIKSYSLTESGEENFHFIFKRLEIFPIVWSFSDERPQIFYETMTVTKLRKFQREDFLNFLKTDPETTYYLLQYITQVLYSFIERINNLQLTNSSPRIISRLLYLAKRHGKHKNGKIVFDFPITQKDISNSINMTRETASKELSRLAKKGLISNNNKSHLVINNVKKLEKELLLYYKNKSL